MTAIPERPALSRREQVALWLASVGVTVAVAAVATVSVGVVLPLALLESLFGGFLAVLVAVWLLLPTVDRPQVADQPKREPTA